MLENLRLCIIHTYHGGDDVGGRIGAKVLKEESDAIHDNIEWSYGLKLGLQRSHQKEH
jgi:hypothetical protein